MSIFLKIYKKLNLIDEDGEFTRKGHMIHCILAYLFLLLVIIIPLFILGYNVGLKAFYGS